MRTTIWMSPPWGQGEPQEFEDSPAVLTPLMVAGWAQCEVPAKKEDVTTDGNNH